MSDVADALRRRLADPRRQARLARLQERRNAADAGLDLIEAVAEGRLDHLHHLLVSGHSPNVCVPLPDAPESTHLLGDRAVATRGSSRGQGAEDNNKEDQGPTHAPLPSRPPSFPQRRIASPLWLAASLGHLDVVQALAEHGADLNAADDEGMTPLVAACAAGHGAVVRWLKDHARVGCTTVQAARAAIAAEAAAREEAEKLAAERKAARTARSERDLLRNGSVSPAATSPKALPATTAAAVAETDDATGAEALAPGSDAAIRMGAKTLAAVRARACQAHDMAQGVTSAVHEEPRSPRYTHHATVDASATPAGYEGVCLWQQRAHNGRSGMWHAAANGHLGVVKYLMRHAEPVRTAEKAALESSLAAAREAAELAEKVRQAETEREASSEQAAELRGQEAENRAAAADCKAQAMKEHAKAAMQLMNAALLVKQALEEKELRLSDDQVSGLQLLLPERFRDDYDDLDDDDGEEDSEDEDEDDESEHEGGGKESDSGSDSGGSDRSSDGEDDGPVVDKPEEWILREARSDAVELIRELEGVAKQYGAPVAKEIGTKCAVARRAGVACVAAEKQQVEFEARAESCVAPREVQERIAEESGRRVQTLSRQVEEAKERESEFEERREVADTQLELAMRELELEVLTPSNCGVTPFAAACAAGQVECATFLARPPPLCPISEIERPDRGGRTPFYMACRGGHLPVVQLLKEAGVDVYIADACGVSPFAIAVAKGRLQLCIYLKLQGLELTNVDVLTKEYYPNPVKRLHNLLAGMRELQLHEMDWFRADCAELKERLRELRRKN